MSFRWNFCSLLSSWSKYFDRNTSCTQNVQLFRRHQSTCVHFPISGTKVLPRENNQRSSVVINPDFKPVFVVLKWTEDLKNDVQPAFVDWSSWHLSNWLITQGAERSEILNIVFDLEKNPADRKNLHARKQVCKLSGRASSKSRAKRLRCILCEKVDFWIQVSYILFPLCRKLLTVIVFALDRVLVIGSYSPV